MEQKRRTPTESPRLSVDPTSESKFFDEEALRRWEDDGGAPLPQPDDTDTLHDPGTLNDVMFVPVCPLYTSDGSSKMGPSPDLRNSSAAPRIAELLLLKHKNEEDLDAIATWAECQAPRVFEIVTLRLVYRGFKRPLVSDHISAVWWFFAHQEEEKRKKKSFRSHLHRVIARYKPERGKFLPYLCASFANELTEALLKELPAFQDVAIGEYPTGQGRIDPPDVAAQETCRVLRRLIDELPQHDKFLIYARFFLGYPYSAIAEKLNISTNAASQRFTRIKSELKPALKQYKEQLCNSATRNTTHDKA